MSARDLLEQAARRLVAFGVEAPEREAARLLAHAWGRPWADLYLEREAVPAGVASAFQAALVRRAAREPFAYIAGRCSFAGIDLAVGPGCLVPRPETELLVEEAFRCLARSRGGRESPGHILELCTGSGAVTLALAQALPPEAARFVATDISPEALQIARANAARLGFAARVEFYEGDLFAALPAGEGSFDLMVANPPYVATHEIAQLAPEVRDWEPRLALDGGPQGLDFYARIARGARGKLAPGGTLLVEIDEEGSREVASLLASEGFSRLEIFFDFAGKPRAVAAGISSVPVGGHATMGPRRGALHG